MATDNRPISPHLQVYDLPLTAILSITHRITGVILSFGMVLMVDFLMAVAQGAEKYSQLNGLFHSFFGKGLLFLWSLAFFVHLCHGVRHLVWDTGYGLSKDDMDKFARVELIAAGVLTVLAWIVA